jgi:hypothetical protein
MIKLSHSKIKLTLFKDKAEPLKDRTGLLNNRKVTKTRKVKEITPSPFYDGKYHPPIISSARLHFETKLI